MEGLNTFISLILGESSDILGKAPDCFTLSMYPCLYKSRFSTLSLCHLLFNVVVWNNIEVWQVTSACPIIIGLQSKPLNKVFLRCSGQFLSMKSLLKIYENYRC